MWGSGFRKWGFGFRDVRFVKRATTRQKDLKALHGTSTYRGTSLIRNCPPLGPYSRPMPRALRRS